ncbi:histidine triad nucleotide-binding protein [Candidatus Peregrinibacteria bacterium HGW-Peregrinibacteria-1]|nr:MAG: histidine triad nucleotide-binding protein [Candidatus Peregrinibacteria bacterium HGW-Peregrinibacteria-1]
MDKCIFCQIVDKEIPASVVYENESCIVFRDVNPKEKTHLLVVPKKHIRTIDDLSDDDDMLMGAMMLCARNVAKLIDLDGYRLQVNVGEGGGQEVYHVHMHLLAK